MSDGLNKVLLIGNLGADPELRYLPSGTAVLSLRLATTVSYMAGSERKERTEWHRVSVWNKRAEGLNKVLSKGSRLFIEGEIRNNTYEDKDGVKRYNYDISAREIILLGGRNETRGDGGQHAPDQGHEQGAVPQPHADDDIPF